MVSDHASSALVQDLLGFLEACPSPYHAVAEAAARLDAASFRRLSERDHWQLQPGDGGYVVRAGGSIVAFRLGTRPPSESGFVIIGAHTDSPNLRLKPKAELAAYGYEQLAVEVYGGVLLSTWLDRELGVAGRVMMEDGGARLVRLPGTFARIPNLAIHLNREVNSAGLVLNPQTHLAPLAALEVEGAGLGLSARIARALGPSFDAAQLGARDLCLFDVQPPTLGGANEEFIFSARLDNLVSCHAGLRALVDAGSAGGSTRVVVLYDHEEVGSQSAAGAGSQFLRSVLARLCETFAPERDAFARAIAGSLLVSSDMAHAVHPNYPDRHDKLHRPLLGKGPVLKVNSSQRYATDAPSAAAFRAACRAADVEPQVFVSRNDVPCGSTIGPISAARLGLRTVDVGGPMLSMHSCREMAAAADVAPLVRVFTELFRRFEPLDPAL